MRHAALGITVTLLIAASVAAHARPSLVGPSGLIMIPTAEVLGMAQWNVGLATMQVEEGADENLLCANVGLIPNLEVGFTREDFKEGEAETLVNAKLALPLLLPGKISLAAGVVDLTDQVDRSVYVVASHTLGAGLVKVPGKMSMPQLHVGIGGGRFDGLFAGISAMVDRRVEVMAEFDGDDINFGGRWTVAPNLDATITALHGLEDFGLGLTLSSPW